MNQQDYYQLLGIRRDARTDEIKQAYRKLIRRYHPDTLAAERAQAQTPVDRHIIERRLHEAHHQTQLINQAYATLSDAEKRRRYDATLPRPKPPVPPKPTTTTYSGQDARGKAYTVYAEDTPRRPPPASTRRNRADYGPDPSELTKRIGLSLFFMIALLFLCEVTVNSMLWGGDEVVQQAQNVEQNRRIEATAYALQIPPQPTTAAEVLMLDGIRAMDENDYQQAVELFSLALNESERTEAELTPNADLYFLRGLAYQQMALGVADRNNDFAVDDFSQAITLQPDFANAYYQRGLIFFNRWRIYSGDSIRQSALLDLMIYARWLDAPPDARTQQIINQLERAAPAESR